MKIEPSGEIRLIDLFLDCSWDWTTYKNLVDVVSPGAPCILLQKENPDDAQRIIIRKRLASKTLYVTYHDIDNNSFKVSHAMSFYGRHFKGDQP